MPRDPKQLLNGQWPLALYNTLRKWFPLVSLTLFPTTFIINAPFGRFTSNPAKPSLVSWFDMPSFQFDGRKSWMLMEIVSPITFIYAFLISPLTFYTPALPAPMSPQALMCGCFLVHYLNRAILSPLRTPSRSKSHLSVFLSGAAFNLANGYLMGSYLSSPMARIYLGGSDVWQRPSFVIGITLWLLGFIGNIAHDEILLNIRRRAMARKEKDAAEKKKKGKSGEEAKGEHYGIPQGLLYKYISFPNYFCEWIEWLGFALAAAPPPADLAFTSPTAFLSSLSHVILPFFTLSGWKGMINAPPYAFAPMLFPPWIFLLNEIVLMFPRAYKGHVWYKERFGESYPKERKAVIPFIL
ncbi:3-oxo-5-alpha-steroid 4-dehydrogenase 1 [Coprinopsis sp. MPI-PUGE-AT-0042]|nr:3-oxo-5-alpha-steroid 4-dehydrogenase 1 [Coprinopsis sp. MPI-PUGE-AT-0042]